MSDQPQRPPVTAPEVPEHDTGERAAAPTSALTNLRQRREKAVKRLWVDLKVPRLDDDGGPPVYVRYKPAPEHRVEAINKQNEKSKDREKNVIANASVLADCCLGVFAVIGHEPDDDGVDQPIRVSIDDEDPHGEWPRFDEHLAQILGVPDAVRADQVVRGLYLTDGDILSTATKLAQWSGYSLNDVEELEGN